MRERYRIRRAIATGLGVVVLVAAGVSVAGAVNPHRFYADYVEASEPAGFAVDGYRLVWADREGDDYDVFLYDALKRQTTRLTSDAADQVSPSISGDVVVWTDYRNGNADIYALDLATMTESQITFTVYDQTHPSVSGKWLVFEHYGNLYYPVIGAIDLTTGSGSVIGSSGYGVRNIRPKVSGTLAVWEAWTGSDIGIRSYDLATGSGMAVTTSPTAEMLPDTDGRYVVWTVSEAVTQLDVAMYDTTSGEFTTVSSGVGDQTRPVLRSGDALWLDRPAVDTPMTVATAATGRKAADPIPKKYRDNRLVAGGGSFVELDSSGGALAWLQRYGNAWRIGLSVPSGTLAQEAALGATRVADRLARALGLGAVTALADVTAPDATGPDLITVSGLTSVALEWRPSQDSESPPVTYDILRHSVEVTSGNWNSADRVATDLSTTSTAVAITSDEASTSYTYHYGIVAKDSVGNSLPPSWSLAPDPHGTSTQYYNCVRCHQGAPHGFGGGGYGALGAKTRYACYGCHGGTSSSTAYGIASTLNTERDMWDYSDQSSTVGSRHRNTYMEVRQSECDACHDPHRRPYYVDATSGEYDPTRSYSEILRVVEATNPAVYLRSTDSTPVGNTFCLDCHGAQIIAIDLVGGSLAYANTAGDHNSAGYATAAHGGDVLEPNDTNPGIQCEVCHDQHASAADRLVDYRMSGTSSSTANYQSGLCFKCHATDSTENTVGAGYTKPFAWNDRDVRSEFTTAARASRHPITTAPSGRSATCVNCHNVHYAGEGDGSAWNPARVVDPANTKIIAPTITDHCLGCHTATPPDALVSDTQLVPYRVGFNPATGWTYFTGWDKSAFKNGNAGHYTTSGTTALCENCHDPHASSSDNLLAWTRPSAWSTGTPGTRNNTDTTLVHEESLCFQCHGNGTQGKQAPGAADVASVVTLAYNHRPDTVTDVHADTETAADLGGAKRHNECVDCHDPHTARKVAGTASQDSTNSSLAGGALYGILGAKPTWTGGMWTAPTSFAPQRLAGTSGDYEAYLCFKCHSSNTAFPGTQTDLALEFNPSNPSFHNVLGQSTGMKSSFTYKDSNGTTQTDTWAIPTVPFLVNNMTSNTMLTCTSCHTNETAGAKGPHGSTVQWLLDPAYPIDWKTVGLYGSGSGISSDGSTDAAAICAKCHDLAPGSNDAHTQSQHYKSASGGYLCIDCHIKIPHGWKRPRLLGSATLDSATYATRSDALDKIEANTDHTLKSGVVSWSSGECDTNGCQHNDNNMVYWP